MDLEIKNLLTQIYSQNESAWLVERLPELLSKYTKSTASNAIGTGDVLLITYGDSILDKTEKPLKTLDRFLKSYGDKFSHVHILPFYPYTSDDGFSVVDFRQINPVLGDWEDIKVLSKQKQLMFDGVINHISASSDWVQGHLSGEADYKDFVLEESLDNDWSQVVRPRTSPLLHPFTTSEGEEVYLWTTFSADQVDLNYRNPKLLLEVLDILCFYVSQGASLIRLDAIGFMWKEAGTSCIHLPKTHFLIQLMRRVIEQVSSDAKLITETNVPHAENISYFGDGHNEAHLVYNFTLPPLVAYSLLSEDTTKLTEWAGSLQLPSDKVCFFNFLASHDGIGLRPVQGILTDQELTTITDAAASNEGRISYKSNPDGTKSPYEVNCNYYSLLKGVETDEEVGIKKMILAHALLLSFPGLPAVYVHSFLGSENDVLGMNETGQNRSINREKLDWEALKKSLANPDSLRSKINQRLDKLIEIRQEITAFNPYAPFKIIKTSEHLFVMERGVKEPVLCIYNFTNTLQQVTIKTDQVDLLTSTHYKIGTHTVEPFGFVWLR